MTCEGSFDQVRVLLNPFPAPVILYKHNPQSRSVGQCVGNLGSLPSGAEFGSVTIRVCKQKSFHSQNYPQKALKVPESSEPLCLCFDSLSVGLPRKAEIPPETPRL